MNRNKELRILAKTAQGIKLKAFKNSMKLQPKSEKEVEVINDFKNNPRQVTEVAKDNNVSYSTAKSWINKFCELNYKPRNDF